MGNLSHMPMLLGLAAGVVMAQSTPRVLYLWPNGAPGSEVRKDEPETRLHPWSIANIQNPSLTVYPPVPGTANGAGVIVAPGGGFVQLVIDEEGTKPAKLLASLGFTAFVLKYRLPNEAGSKLDLNVAPQQDALRAMRYVRAHAAQWGLDADRIGMMGFSAGGVVLSHAAFDPGAPNRSSDDPIERVRARPNFAMFIYPGGDAIPADIPADAPPAFAIVADDDGLADSVVKLITGYRAAHIPIEAHILRAGGHGFNMGDRSKLASVNSWPQLLVNWLADSGYSKKH